MSKKSLFYQEKGSMAIYAVATVLCFIILLGGVFFSSSIVRKSQLRTLLKIKDVYAEQIKQVSQIEENRNKLDVSGYTQNGLVLFYDGINNTGSGHSDTANTWTDLSNTGNHGNLTNMQENGKNSWRENSLHFDGKDDVVVVPYQNSLDSNEYTIELVLNRSEILNNRRSIVFVKWYGYTIELNANQTISFGYRDEEPYLKTTDILDLNEKYYLTATFKNNVQKVYINGIQVAEKTGAQPLSQQQTDLTIGGWRANATDPFIGNIYAVRMYNRELSGQEINNNYNLDHKRYEVKGYIRDGLVLQYDGLNNTGKGHSSTTTTWKDLSGNGKDGILKNFDTTTNGWQANGLILDGSDDGIWLGDNLKDLFQSENTVEILLKIDETQTRDIIIGNYAQANTINIENAQNKLRTYLNDSTVNNYSANEFFVPQKMMLFTNLFMKQSNKIEAYRDTIKQWDVNSSVIGSYNYNWSNAWIGRDSRTGTTCLKGTIYAVRIYNRVLTEEERKVNYQMDQLRYPELEEKTKIDESIANLAYAKEGLVLCYDGINHTGTDHPSQDDIWKDLSGNGNDGALIGTQNNAQAIWGANHLVLDGQDDGIFLGNQLSQLFKSGNTLEMVMSLSENNTRDVLLGNYNYVNAINYENSANRMRLYVNSGTIDSYSTAILPINQTFYCNISYDKATNRILYFQNNVNQYSVTNSEVGSYNYNFNNAWIGRDIRTGTTCMKGNIYAVRVYNRVLPENERTNNYTQDKTRYGF